MSAQTFCGAAGHMGPSPSSENGTSHRNEALRRSYEGETKEKVSDDVVPNENGEHECHWSYDGVKGPKPDKWGDLVFCMPGSVCDRGSVQSPIEIPSGLSEESANLKLENYDKGFAKFDVDVDGHAIMVMIKEGGAAPSVESEDVLGEGKFVLKQFHFHLGTNDSRGAEHKIDEAGHGFPMEAHFVHAKEGKSSVNEALKEPGNVLVVAVLFQVEDTPADDKADAALQAIVDKIGVTTDSVKKLKLDDFIGPITSYYNYKGSLTTPPCTEGVEWIVLDSHPSVKKKTLQALRDKSPKVPKDNFRPYKTSQNREVKKYTTTT
ncbi:carbonic anhydrase isoform X1 [Dermacentor silvarum]|uniref:carbonic anhydrase isoform X1 n=1 Tax=Dermacentor silvarum TaxID=543639 RepID=UPI002101D4A7|nr:carbonic anhydrase isoform X1 [Dermacentor silvarum]